MKIKRKFMAGFLALLLLSSQLVLPCSALANNSQPTNQPITKSKDEPKKNTKEKSDNNPLKIEPLKELKSQDRSSSLEKKYKHVKMNGLPKEVQMRVDRSSFELASTGDPLNDLFINVPTLKAGDNFYIKHKDKTIDKYTIFDTKTVSPIDELKQYIIPTENETFVTLRTCVPIGINSQRFLATGSFQGNVEAVEQSKQALSLVDYTIALVIFVNVGLLIWSFESDRKRGER